MVDEKNNTNTKLLNSDMELQARDQPPSYQSTLDQSVAEQTRRVLRGPLAPVNNALNSVEDSITTFVKEQKKILILITVSIFLVLYTIYFAFAVSLNADRASDLIYVTAFAVFCFVYWLVKKFFGRTIWKQFFKPISELMSAKKRYLEWGGSLLLLAFLIFWIAWDTSKEPQRLISFGGLAVYILLGFLGSKKRDQIKWRPVVWGFALQFIFGILILRTTVGYNVFDWLGDRVTIFLNFASAGTEFLFGKSELFAFSVLPIIVYFSSVTYVFYYLGWMQTVIKKVAWLLQVTLGTSPAESVNAAGNIFIGQTEAPLLIRPFLQGMTDSELHAVLTGGFATIAGSVLATYIKFGVSASHLLSASVMSAPAALAMSKLMYPETDEPEFSTVDEIQVEATEEKNIFEALAVGASMSISLVANIAVMLIAFLSILALFNSILSWSGGMVGLAELSFEFICQYVFMPLAFVMGVDLEDSFYVAELLGVKTFLNEFIAYQRLGEIIKNRVLERDGIKISIRSEVICTYALCGFANFGSMGVQLGGISVLAPNKRSTLSRLIFRALIAGTLACFMTACVAGILYDVDRYDTTIHKTTVAPLLNTTMAPTN